MSDDDAMEADFRRSPRKRGNAIDEAESGNAIEAARKIIKNKEKQKNADSGKTKDKLQMDKGKTAVETSARSAKKTKTAQKGVTEEVKAEDDNMFGVEPYTDAEAKKQLEAQNKLLKSSKAKPKNGNVVTEEVMKLRQRQEYIKAAEKKKKNEEESVRLQELHDRERSRSPTTTPDSHDSNDDIDTALKKKIAAKAVHEHRSRNPLSRTGSHSSQSSSVTSSPHSNYNPSPHRAVGAGRKSYSKLPLITAEDVAGNEKGILRARTILAINDIAPRKAGKTPVPFMYWQTHQPHLCATQLISRYKDLEKYANQHYHGIPQMAHTHATLIRNAANNERSVQVTSINKIWLNASSPFALAFPLIANNACTEENASASLDFMKLSTSVEISGGVESISDLRNLIRSSEMYKNDTVFTLFCQGLESGMLKQSMKLNPTPLASLITIAHEAHFRAELWLHLGRATFKHSATNEHIQYRKSNFDEFCEFVAKDREDNEADASSRRLGRDLNGDAEDEDTTAPINPKYY
jgi:hypothetical protein